MKPYSYDDGGSVSTQAYYNNDAGNTRDSTADSAPPIHFPSAWCKTRKRSDPYYHEEQVQSTYNFETLQAMMGLDRDQTLKILIEFFCKNNQEFRAAVKNFQDRILQNVEEEEQSSNTTTDYMGVFKKIKKKKTQSKPKKLSKFVGEDDLKGAISSYVCRECNEVFEDYRALGGHIASHNRKRRATLDLSAAEFGNDGFVGEAACGQKNYKCDLCSRSFPTGQALGGHKTYHRKIAQLQATTGQPTPCSHLQLDLNASPVEGFWGI